MVKRDLKSFPGRLDFTPREKFRLAIWILVANIFFKSTFLPSRFRPFLLRIFGATVGSGVLIRRGVRVHFPWNLSIGDDCWIGEEVLIIDHERVTIGSNVCISQRAIIASGSHDYRSKSLEFDHKPVLIRDGAWICLDAKVLPGVTIGECSVVSAGEVVRKSLPDHSMLVGDQIHKIVPPK